MKKTLYPYLSSACFLALIITAIVLLTACQKPSTSGTSPDKTTLARVKKTKTIHALYLVYPPTVIVEKDPRRPTGFLIDVMNEIAARAGLLVEYSPTTFDDMSLAVSSPNSDVVVGAIFVNVPRAKEMGFTTPILYWQGTIGISPADKARSFKDWTDIDKPGIRIAVSSGTAEYDFVKQHIKSATLNAIPNSDLSLTLSEVTAGRADIAFGDAVTVGKFLRDHPGFAAVMGGQQLNSFAASFALKQDDHPWIDFLNESILSLQVDGTIDNQSRKWNAGGIWLLPKRPWE